MDSPCDRAAALQAISALIADLQSAYDDRDRAMAQHLGVGRTDLRCLDILVREGPASAAELAPRLHLTPGSMSTLVQRLEAARYVHRQDDPDHGRRKIIAVTEHLIKRIVPLVAHLANNGAQHLDPFSDAEVTTIHRYLSAEVARQQHNAAAAALEPGRPKASRPALDHTSPQTLASFNSWGSQ